MSAAPLTPLSNGSHVFVGGYTVAFDMSIAFLLVGLVLVSVLWREHYKAQTPEGAAPDKAQPLATSSPPDGGASQNLEQVAGAPLC